MPSTAYDCNSSSLTHINDALALSPNLSSNMLTHEERTALRKSDRKAEKLLGVTLTRDVKTLAVQQDLGLGRRAPLGDLMSSRANSIVDAAQNIGALMAAIGAKRARSREFSEVTLVGALRDLGSGISRMGRKKRCVGGTYPRRVILGPLRDLESRPDGSGSSSAGSETPSGSPRHSFLDLEYREECVKTPTFGDFPQEFGPIEDDEGDYEQERPKGFVWDIADPFATPENKEGYDLLLHHFTKLRMEECIGPLDKIPLNGHPHDSMHPTEDEISPAVTLVQCSRRSSRLRWDSREHVAISPIQASRRSSCDSWSCQENVGLGPLPSDLEYANTVLALDEAEEEARVRRKQKRDTLRSRLKKLALLGSEARQAVDGETIE